MTATLERQPTAPQLPRAQREPAPDRRRDPKRLALTGLGLVALVLVLMFVHERLIGPMLHDNRQQHLAASFNTPAPSLVAGGAMGVLQIPRLELSTVVVEGVSVDSLRGGPAHRIDSALPGDPGVVVLYGHRSMYGGPFADIDQLLEKDEIVVQARTGPIVRYVVQRVERDAHLGDLELAQTDRISYLLLVTSEPGRTAGDEVIVVARALPLSDVAPVVPDLTVGVDDAAPLGIDTLLGAISVAAAMAAWGYLRRRSTSTGVTIVVLLPLLAYPWLHLALLLDAVGPITR